MKRFFTLSLLITVFSVNFNCKAAIITAITDGGVWSSGGSWDLARAPMCGDTIIVPSGIDLRISTNIDLDTGDPLCGAVRISIGGSIAFNHGRKMRLAAGACITVETGGKVRPSLGGGGASENISIDGTKVWEAGDGTLNGYATMGCPVLLPVEISDFSLEYIDDQAEISFTSSSERNLDYYTIEISKDGSYWQELEKIQSHVNSSTEISYKVVDKFPFMGISYYRLKNIDLNGETRIVDIIVGEYLTEKYLVYPIPVNQFMFIEGSKLENAVVQVSNYLGEKIELESSYFNDKYMFNFSEIKNGLYLVTIETSNSKIIKRVTVAHK